MMNYPQGQIVGSQNAQYPDQSVPVREPQVMSEVSRLHHSIEQLGKGIEALTQRLSGVLRSEPPSPTATGKSIGEVMVPMAEQISGARQHVQGLSNAVESLLQRLEL